MVVRTRAALPLALVAACAAGTGAHTAPVDAPPEGAADASVAPSDADAHMDAAYVAPSDADAPGDGPLDSAQRDAANEGGSNSVVDAGLRSCDARAVLCRRAPPVCGAFEAPSLEGTCWGPCVPIAECACHVADDCPDRDRFVCHLYAQRCGPYVE